MWGGGGFGCVEEYRWGRRMGSSLAGIAVWERGAGTGGLGYWLRVLKGGGRCR